MSLWVEMFILSQYIVLTSIVIVGIVYLIVR